MLNIIKQQQIKDIAIIKEVKKGIKLPEEICIIDNMIKPKYILQKINSVGKISRYGKDEIVGNFLEIKFTLFKPLDAPFSHFRLFRNNLEVTDWSKYKTVNFFFKTFNLSSIINFLILEKDNDIWHFINPKQLEANKWYLISIPLQKMFIFEEHKVEKRGDKKQDLRQIIAYWFDFSNFNQQIEVSQRPYSNTVQIGKLFLE